MIFISTEKREIEFRIFKGYEMKKGKTDPEFDEVIGGVTPSDISKKEHDALRAYRLKLYEERSSADKIDDILTGFKFRLDNYVANENPKDIIHLGQFLNTLLDQINIKKVRFAEYIEISGRNIHKYFNGERKFNIDHALKLEKLFHVNAETLLEIQLKNELLEAKFLSKGNYDKYTLKDLLPD